MPFEFDVTAFADDKDHFIAIRIDSSEENRYLPNSFNSNYNGIIGSIEIIARETLTLEDWSYSTKLIYKFYRGRLLN